MNSDTRSPIGFLPAGWKLDSLKNITTKIGSGSTPRGGEAAYLEERIEYAFIRSQNVFDFQFSESEVKYISDSDANKLKNVHLQRDDLLLNITGDGITFGRCCIVPEEILPAAVNQHVSIIRLDQEKCLSGYLLAYLCLPQIKEYISNFNAGGSRRAITKGHIETFDIPLPPMSIQRSIQRFTFDVMHKVRANTQLNQNLEKIAQAIFKSWFVDFEPTKAKITAREALLAENPAATPEQIATAEQQAAIQAIAGAGDVIPTEQLQTIAELFPNQFADSELGGIPYGWEIKALDQIAHYQNGLALQKFRPESGEDFLPVLKIAQLKAGFADGKEVAKASIKKECIVDNGDVIFSWSGSLVVDIWCGGRVALNQHLFKVTSDTYPKWFYYKWTKYHLEKFQQIAADKAVTMGHIKRSHLSEAKCLIPASELIKNKFISSLIDKQIQVRLESKVLSEVRDSLLPRLLAGEFLLAKVDSEYE